MMIIGGGASRLRFVPSVEVHSKDGTWRIECSCPAEWFVIAAGERSGPYTTRERARNEIRLRKAHRPQEEKAT